MKREYTLEQLEEQLQEATRSSWDGKNRLRDCSSKIEADDHVWGVVSDHGNVELGHRGRNGHMYWHGGLV